MSSFHEPAPEPPFGGKNETVYQKIGRCIAEALGTATLMFIGCMGVIGDANTREVTLFAPFSFGLAVATAIQLYGHLSGSHFNPVVTVAALILCKIEPIMVPFYILSQIAGALLGYTALMIVTPSDLNNGVCVTYINPRIEVYQGFIIEVIITGLLISICCAVWDKRTTGLYDSIPIRFGLMLSSIFIATAQFTGASINPARSLAPAIYQNMWENHWVYWVAPTVGAVLSAVFYKYTYIEGLAKMGKD